MKLHAAISGLDNKIRIRFLLFVLPETAAVLQVSYGRDRFRIPSDMRLDNASSMTEPPLKRQKLSRQPPSGTADSAADPILWRVCYEEFNRSFRWVVQRRLLLRATLLVALLQRSYADAAGMLPALK